MTARPVPLPVQADGIPADLIAANRFVVWKYVVDDKGKWTKPPFVASHPARLASSTDATTWCPYTVALAAYHDGKCDGIGVPMGDGRAGVDHVQRVDLPRGRGHAGHIHRTPGGPVEEDHRDAGPACQVGGVADPHPFDGRDGVIPWA